MATLTVWKFDTADGAKAAAKQLETLSREMLISIHDAAIVSWPSDSNKPKTKQLKNLVGRGSLGGAFWGLLFGLIFFVPLLGAALGAAVGAFSGSLADVGIDDSFINRTRDQITPGTSALFLLSSDAVLDKVKDGLIGVEPVELLFTNLDAEQEAALRAVFAD